MPQPAVKPVPKDLSFEGKTVIVTGGTGGIGLASAKQFLEHKAEKVYITARDKSRATRAVDILKTVASENRIGVLELDLLVYKSVVNFVDQVKALPSVDIVVLNAGGMIFPDEKVPTADGHVKCLQCNYLSNAYIAYELAELGASRKNHSEPFRITWVGSRVGENSKFEAESGKSVFETFDTRKKSSFMTNYADSKLFVNIWVEWLAKKYSPDSLIINVLCPGAIASDATRNAAWYLRIAAQILFKVYSRSTEVAGWIVLNAASAGKESDGRFFYDKNLVEHFKYYQTPQGKKLIPQVIEETQKEISTISASA